MTPTEHRRQILENFMVSQSQKPLIVILGPTASGKTAFSISLAHELKNNFGKTAEVVNADSRQFYRGFDIGTAKITPEEQQGIAHHMIDVLDPADDCTIAWYQSEAKRVIADIHARGNIPVLVGGSMLYVSALVDGLQPMAASDPTIRERLNREYETDHGKTLYERLTVLDPETAASFPMQNKVYVVRAMEIYESTGKTKSSQKKTSVGPYNLLMFGMDVDKQDLDQRIANRTNQMLERGWIQEVEKLKKQGVQISDPAMKSVGYREIFVALESPHPRPLPRSGGGGSVPTDTILALSETIESQTRAYAKRHRTWWKRDTRIVWIKI